MLFASWFESCRCFYVFVFVFVPVLVFSSRQEILNFTFTIEKPTDGEWGVLQKDGSWSGMVGMLDATVT